MTASLADMERDPLDEIFRRLRALGPSLRDRGRQTEAEGRVAADTIATLFELGALDLTKPGRFGGRERPPSTLIRLGFELGQYCGSTAWCASLANCNAWFATFWPEAAQRDIWDDDPAALVAGVAIPTGAARRVEGGYRISGGFPFASNIDNSRWLFVSAIIAADEAAPAATGWFLIPAEQVAIDQRSWQVSGLQATGSKTVVIDSPVFVPDHRALMFADVAAGQVPGMRDGASRMARFGYTTFGAAALVGPMLGMAKGALDCFAEGIAGKLRVTFKPGAPVPASANPFVQARIGAATAAIDAALALVLQRLGDAEAKLDAGCELDVADRVGVRGALGFVARQSVLVTNSLAEAAGAAGAALDLPLQRFWRDVNAAGRHASLDPQALEALVGQQRLGLPLVGSY